MKIVFRSQDDNLLFKISSHRIPPPGEDVYMDGVFLGQVTKISNFFYSEDLDLHEIRVTINCPSDYLKFLPKKLNNKIKIR